MAGFRVPKTPDGYRDDSNRDDSNRDDNYRDDNYRDRPLSIHKPSEKSLQYFPIMTVDPL